MSIEPVIDNFDKTFLESQYEALRKSGRKGKGNEACERSADCFDCKNLVNCNSCRECEDSRELLNCIKVKNSRSCKNCTSSENIFFSENCNDCKNCLLCYNLQGKKEGFWILNEEVTEAEFNEALEKYLQE